MHGNIVTDILLSELKCKTVKSGWWWVSEPRSITTTPPPHPPFTSDTKMICCQEERKEDRETQKDKLNGTQWRAATSL